MAWTTSTTLAGHSNPIQYVYSRLRAILPEQLDREFLASTGLIKLDENAQYHSLAMYLISNNMLQEVDNSKVMGYFEHQRGWHLLNSLLSKRGLPAVDAFAEKLLVIAARVANTMIIKELLKAGLDPNTQDGYNFKQPLQYAAERGNIELVQILLVAGADINAAAADNYGRTALQTAAEQGNIELVHILLAAGADVNAAAADIWGRTALQAAAGKGNIELVHVLLAAGADVNGAAADNYGRTALQAAAGQGNIELVHVLLAAGADVNAAAADEWGLTALQAAAGDRKSVV